MEKIYLDYISTYISAKEHNAHLFRTFVDNWFAYHVSGPFLNSKGKPKWFNNPDPVRERAALLDMHFISQAAQDVLDGNRRTQLVKDHAIPLLVLRDRMFQYEKMSPSDISLYLRKNYKLGLITREENRRLDELGFRQKMPEAASDPYWLSRYQSAAFAGTQTYST